MKVPVDFNADSAIVTASVPCHILVQKTLLLEFCTWGCWSQAKPEHLHNVGTRFYDPQAHLTSDFQCRVTFLSKQSQS